MISLSNFLKLAGSQDVRVIVQEPGKCMTFMTELRKGISNIHTLAYLTRGVYAVDVGYDANPADRMLVVHVW